MLTRRHTLAAGLVTAALLATGCSGGSGSTSSGTSGQASQAALDRADYNPQPWENLKDGGTYTTSGSFSGTNTQGNPWNVNSSLTANRIWNWYNPMAITFSTAGDVEVNKDYFTSAESKTVDGKQVVTLTINPKATYNDGTPIDWTAIDATVKAASGRLSGAQVGSTTGYDQIESVKQGVDAKQAVVTFSKPYAPWAALFTSFLHPKAAASAATFNDAYSNTVHPEWGAGPFTVESYDKNTKKLVFARNPKWWGRTARLDKRIYLDFPNAQANVNAFKSGQVDYAVASTAEAQNQVKDVANSERRQGGSPFQYSLYLNGRSPLLGDVAVRRGIMAAVDRAQIAKIQFQGLNYTEPLPGSMIYYTWQKGYQDNLSKVLTPGAEEAGKVLDAAGWKPGADGIRVKDGKRLSVGYTLFGSDPTDKAMAQSIVAAEKKAGVEVKIQPADDSQWSAIINEGKFDLMYSGNRSSDPYGATMLGLFYGSKTEGNLSRIGSPEVDAEIARVNAIADPAEQQKAANEVEQKAMALYNVMPLFSGPSTYQVKKGLANVGATLIHNPLPETIGWQK